jgi:hypothetical protein
VWTSPSSIASISPRSRATTTASAASRRWSSRRPRMPAISDRSAIAAIPTIHWSAGGAISVVSRSQRSAPSRSPSQ